MQPDLFSNLEGKKGKQYFTREFEKAINALNDKQKEAVETIEGPVMVIAGPGTGKTQLLAARIGRILKEGVAEYHNILCLTYTDAGSVAMRQRLLQFIGPDAYNVNIFTFHSFCNLIIKENIEYFGGYRDLQRVSDLELVDILHEIIDDFDDNHVLKRYRGDIYYERDRLKRLFGTMKQENWNSQQIIEAYTKYEKEVYEDEEYLYKRKTGDKKKGDLNEKKIKKELKRYQSGVAAAGEFNKYNELLLKNERIDYNDMILWVIKAFKENPDLLSAYQERFQYILVDEYQDTNGSQNEIINLLTSYWGKDANVFVVGDDDQSIFRFQGANMQNIVEFDNHYNPRVIVLDNNYRSSQEILDRSSELISNNAERLIALKPELTKNLLESKTKDLIKVNPQILQYHNEKHEEKAIINKIVALQNEGVNLNEIAIIYRKHRNISDILKYLEYHNVPVNLKKRINILHEPEIKRLINILTYIRDEYKRMHTGEHLIFEILHYNYFGLKAREIGKLSLYLSRKTDKTENDIKWRDILNEEEELKKVGLKEVNHFLEIGAFLEECIQDVPNSTIQMLFEKILTKGKIIEAIMLDKNDKSWRLQIVNTFFDFIKNETSKDSLLGLDAILGMVQKMDQARIDLPLERIFFAKEGVNLMTAHGAKGLEFEHVFIIKCFQSNWVEKNYGGGGSFKLPKSLVSASDKSDIEDDRRLFYVAMTRAKSYLYISTPKMSNEDKDLDMVVFVHELMRESDLKIQEVHLDDSEIEDYVTTLMRYKEGAVRLIDHQLIDKILVNYKVSVTSLNKYLRCPLAFYFENVLRVPLGRSASMGFGNAIHLALEKFFVDIESDPQRKIGDEVDLVNYFHSGMKKYGSHFTIKEHELRSTYGEKILRGYYKNYVSNWSTAKQFISEYSISLTEYKGVPITGKLDKIEVYDDHVVVVDYKTGKYSNAKKKLKPPMGEDDPGEDYWRQLVFYKLLLSGDPRNNHQMRYGIMDFVEPVDELNYKQERREIEAFEVEIVENQLVETYQNILEHKFENGCGEDHCKWCDFVTSNFKLNSELIGYEDDEENN
ncbi:MAG: ATP-dependent DNA helicase [Saprospiraceae bacterium]|nr:ATP-dependent DNA helicase [Saprospiraceae bacterium]|tara:strand:- start:2092 stop:5274 length:3183 start_codon:yes stop_codon:yes gene_type:complete